MNRSAPVSSRLSLKHSCRLFMTNLAPKPDQKMDKHSIYWNIITRFCVPSSQICLWRSPSLERVQLNQLLPPLRHSNGWIQRGDASSQQMPRKTFCPLNGA